MRKLGVISIAVLLAAIPASAEKVAYLLEETGQITVHQFIDLPDEPDYQNTFEFSGPFFGSFTHAYWDSPAFGSDDYPAQIHTSASLNSTVGSASFFAYCTTSGFDPIDAALEWFLSWRFRVGDESMQAIIFADPSGHASASLFDEESQQRWIAGENQAIVNLDSNHLYVWEVHLKVGDDSEMAGAFIDFDGTFVPEPCSLALLAAALALLGRSGRRGIAPSFALILTGIILAATPALATTYYVAPDGDDSNPGTAQSPWFTLRPFTARLVHQATSVTSRPERMIGL